MRSITMKTLKLKIRRPQKLENLEDSRQKMWIRIPFLGKQGDFLIKKLIKKLQRNLTEPVKFIVIYQTKKISYFFLKRIKFLLTTYST